MDGLCLLCFGRGYNLYNFDYMKLLYRLFAQIILLFSKQPDINIWDRIRYAFEWIIHVFPIAFALNYFGIWFSGNRQFAGAMFWLLIGNMLMGALRHHRKTKTFSWVEFFKKNFKMVLIVIGAYLTLETLVIIIGQQTSVVWFEILIQVSTALYPVSKILKNIHIYSDGKHPPQWIMDRLYNFEKDGDLSKLISKNNEQNN